MVYQSDYREAACAAIDTAYSLTEKGAGSPGDFDLPANASRITEIVIQALGAYTADTALGFTTAVRLSGSGITGEQNYPGPSGYTAGATNITPVLGVAPIKRYLTNIPFTPGGSMKVEAFGGGEDPGAFHVQVGIVYDGIPGRIRSMDYREGNLTGANTPVELADRCGSTVGKFKVSAHRISEIHLDATPKVTEGAGLTCPTGFHFSGPGFLHGAEYHFVGPAMVAGDDATTVAGESGFSQGTRYICGTGIRVKPGNTITVEAMFIEDDIGSAWAIAGLGYT